MESKPPDEKLPERLAGMLVEPRSGEPLVERDGWLWHGDRQLYPVFRGIPIVQPTGLYSMTGLLHLTDAAHKAIAADEAAGIEAAISPGEGDDFSARQRSGKLARLKEGSHAFWQLLQQLVPEATSTPGGIALDIGCGHGIDMVAPCRHFDFVVGVEPQLDRCVIARRHLQRMGIRNFAIICGSAEELPLKSGTFRLAAANQVVEHIADRPRAFREIARVLAPGGEFAFALPTRYSLRPEPHLYLMFLGWLPRSLQGPYAKLRRGNSRYTSYTNLVANWRLARELGAAFGKPPRLQAGAELVLPRSGNAARLAAIFRALCRTPFRTLIIEASGAQCGVARKD